MNVDSLQEAVKVLGEVSENLRNMPEKHDKTLSMCLHIQMINLFLNELTLHLLKGEDPYDALLKAAVGDTPLDSILGEDQD